LLIFPLITYVPVAVLMSPPDASFVPAPEIRLIGHVWPFASVASVFFGCLGLVRRRRTKLDIFQTLVAATFLTVLIGGVEYALIFAAGLLLWIAGFVHGGC
jgi:hypothetical protein